MQHGYDFVLRIFSILKLELRPSWRFQRKLKKRSEEILQDSAFGVQNISKCAFTPAFNRNSSSILLFTKYDAIKGPEKLLSDYLTGHSLLRSILSVVQRLELPFTIRLTQVQIPPQIVASLSSLYL